MIVIGITGKIGSGKDTAARVLVEKFGFVKLDFTKDVLAPALVKRGLGVTRDNLIELATEGRKKHHNGIWAEKISALIRMSSRVVACSGPRRETRPSASATEIPPRRPPHVIMRTTRGLNSRRRRSSDPRSSPYWVTTLASSDRSRRSRADIFPRGMVRFVSDIYI